MIDQKTIDVIFAALCCWREARGEPFEVKVAQIWCQRNRVEAHWIHDNTYQDVACHPHQFSGLTQPGDPNLVKFPESSDHSWQDCILVAEGVTVNNSYPDPTQHAVFYHDVSIKEAPAVWGPVTRSVQVGRLVFYRAV